MFITTKGGGGNMPGRGWGHWSDNRNFNSRWLRNSSTTTR